MHAATKLFFSFLFLLGFPSPRGVSGRRWRFAIEMVALGGQECFLLAIKKSR